MQVINLALRLAWTESVMKIRFSKNETRLLDFSLASLEIIRRGHWNFYRYLKLVHSWNYYLQLGFLVGLKKVQRYCYNLGIDCRLENEHLNNVGKFRAVKTVPLPFRELETD
jgi:hypothetical protein